MQQIPCDHLVGNFQRGYVLPLLLFTLPLCCSGDIIALNKPSGVAVHSGPKVKSDLSRYLHYWQYEEHQIPELAHRLDKLVPLAIAHGRRSRGGWGGLSRPTFSL